MPKLKTKRGVRRRFKITKTGKVLAYHAGKIHFKRRKRANTKRKLRQKQILATGDAKRVKKMLPYA
ncbi:MAG TPA: 50S ribosomal protein L35 [candidate division Zixibacteria bacterium]|nr:50S ribosomal protein L35 [bacterium]HHH81181.1 50S ribosomal protein L35 [candidate division Zixibacteria bacterium]